MTISTESTDSAPCPQEALETPSSQRSILKENSLTYSSFQQSLSASFRSNATASSSRGPRVHFGNVNIYEFTTTIGDNPECGGGCPLALEPVGKKCNSVKVLYYERFRGKRRDRDQLRLSVKERTKRLIRAGYSVQEISDGTMRASTVRGLRSYTNKQQRWDGVNALVELTRRRIFTLPKRLLTRKDHSPLTKTLLKQPTTPSA